MATIPKSKIPNIEMFISTSSLAFMTIITVVQVFNRYVLENSLDWSEEIARYFFIWAVYVGCSYAVQLDRHLEVTILRTAFNGKFKKPITVLSLLITLFFCVFVTVIGTKFIFFLISTGQKTPALEIQMYWVYLCMPVGLGFMALRTCERLWCVYTNQVNDSDTAEIKE